MASLTDPNRATTRRRYPWNTIGLCIGACALLALVILLGYRAVFFSSTFGTCNRITGWCHDVPLDTVGMIAGYTWPDGTTVIKSEATLPPQEGGIFTSLGRVTATLRLGPDGALISMGNGYAYPTGQPDTDDIGPRVLPSIAAQFRAEGAKNIKVMRKRDSLVVLSGTRDGEKLVFVSSAYNNA